MRDSASRCGGFSLTSGCGDGARCISWPSLGCASAAHVRHGGAGAHDRSTASGERDDYDESRKIPAARRARMWCAVSRSITIIVPPQRGHGQEVDGVIFSTVDVTGADLKPARADIAARSWARRRLREKPKEANPDEALRQHVQEESTQEFDGADGHGP